MQTYFPEGANGRVLHQRGCESKLNYSEGLPSLAVMQARRPFDFAQGRLSPRKLSQKLFNAEIAEDSHRVRGEKPKHGGHRENIRVAMRAYSR